MLPVSALVRDENMVEFTERLTLEDFRGQNCPFVCDWLQKRGLQKLCSVFITKLSCEKMATSKSMNQVFLFSPIHYFSHIIFSFT